MDGRKADPQSPARSLRRLRRRSLRRRRHGRLVHLRPVERQGLLGLHVAIHGLGPPLPQSHLRLPLIAVAETLVMKFGGTSVANAERLKRAARRIVARREQGKRVVAVLSARGSTTDELTEMAFEVSP